MTYVDPTIGRRTATDPRQHVRYTVGFFTDDTKLNHIVDPLERAAALTLLAASIGLTAEHGGDGHIRPELVLAATGLPEEIAKILVSDDAWHQADHGCRRCPQPQTGCVYVHDYLKHNRSDAQVRSTAESRRRYGIKGANSRWRGHEPPATPKRGPGRPRKHPRPEPAVTAADLLGPAPAPATPPPPAATTGTQLALVPVERDEGAPVLQHPAELKARKSRGRPRRTEPREFDPVIDELCDKLADWIARNDPNGVRPKVTDTWRNICRLMIEVDGREPEKVAIAIDWCQRDSFWNGNIKSMKKLREKYATLQAHAKRAKSAAVSGSRRPGQPPAAVTVANMNALYDDDYATPEVS